MSTTSSSALSQIVSTTVQNRVLKNLRATLHYADPRYSEQGEFDPGSDTIRFVSVPDLTLSTTVLTEGTPPTAQALTFTTTTLSTAAYGETVEITDLAKVKSLFNLVELASERLARQAQESIDKVARDVIAAGGTPHYPIGSTNTVRSDIAAGENMTGADLIHLRAVMKKNKIEPFSDGSFYLWISNNQAYDLKKETTDDTGFIDVSKYTSNTDIMRGELGKFHGFRIMEVNNAPTFSSTVTVHAGIAVGSLKGWGTGDLQTLKTYYTPPGGLTDPLHQKEILGYKVNFGVAVLSNGRYYRAESDASSLA